MVLAVGLLCIGLMGLGFYLEALTNKAAPNYAAQAAYLKDPADFNLFDDEEQESPLEQLIANPVAWFEFAEPYTELGWAPHSEI